MDQSKFESLTEETWEEIARKMWELSTTKIIKQLKVSKMINDFSRLENILKLKEVIPNSEIVFDFKYDKTKFQFPSWNFKMYTKAVKCVYRGREWNFEQIDNWEDENICCFFDIKQIKNSSYVILKIHPFIWKDLVIKKRSWVDDWIKPYIDELKKDTETNNDLFIIADLNNLEIYLSLSDIEKYSSLLKYFKHIIILILPIDLGNQESIAEINNVPKQYHYELCTYYRKDVKFDFSNLIDPRFENLSIKYLWFSYEIKIKRSKSTSNELVSELNITTINLMSRQMIKTDSEYLKQLLYE